MRRIPVVVAAVAFLSTLWSSGAHAGLSAKGVQVFTAENNQVEVVVVALTEPNKFLIRVTGSRSPFDNLVLPYTFDASSSRTQFYRTEWRGQGYSFLEFSTPPYGGEGRMLLYSPDDLRRNRQLTYSEARSKAVKPGDLISQHEKQLKDGSIARFARFDRAGEQAKHEKELAESINAANAACGTKIPFKVVWSGITDDQMKSLSISSFCESPISGLQSLCSSAAVARDTVKSKVTQVTCEFGAAMKIEIAAGTLRWITAENAVNADDFARKEIEQKILAAPSSGSGAKVASGEAVPWGNAQTLAEKIALEKTTVCTDGKSAFVIVAPDPQRSSRLYYGNGKKFNRVPHPNVMLSGDSFFDPRNVNPTANPNFRGADMRLYSSVDADPAKKTCSVRCGARNTSLTLLDPKTAGQMLLAASFQPPLHTRKPHALTRDDKGIYYYVDRGTTPETEKNFRLFVGPRGKMKLNPMKDIISDSQGEIFSTKNGTLRFILGPNGTKSTWIKGKKTVNLTAVPIAENYQLIYNELGVYTGERLGTPCDDL